MSVEEEVELKNLVAQALENKGILPKIRAELRANVFLALEENPATKETLLQNEELSTFLKFPIGSLVLNLIREFLEFFELDFTLSVFDPETQFGKEYSSVSREKMMKELKITECHNKNPLLYEVIQRVVNGCDTRELSSVEHANVSTNSDTGQIMEYPLFMNSTFVMEKSENAHLPVSPDVKDKSKEDESNTIQEELMSNYVSDSESLELNLEKSPREENSENEPSPHSSNDSKSDSPKSLHKNNEEIDLLTFTPVKDSISKEVIQSHSTLPVNEIKTGVKKDGEKSAMSILGDLPPLTVKQEESGDKMNKIKAIIDTWPGLENEEECLFDSKDSKEEINKERSATTLKSDRSDHSQKSDKTETPDEFEEDISDLLNGHAPSEGQLTVDETISKVSCDADYLESI